MTKSNKSKDYSLAYELGNLNEARLKSRKLRDQGYNVRLHKYNKKLHKKPYKIFTCPTQFVCLKHRFFIRKHKKYILYQKYKDLKEAEAEFNKLIDEGFLVILNQYSPNLHYEPYWLFKGPKGVSKRIKEKELKNE